ncbi:MAG: hypothetical protein AAGK32_10830 [Actinomycetota bacterium]
MRGAGYGALVMAGRLPVQVAREGLAIVCEAGNASERFRCAVAVEVDVAWDDRHRNRLETSQVGVPEAGGTGDLVLQELRDRGAGRGLDHLSQNHVAGVGVLEREGGHPGLGDRGEGEPISLLEASP